MKNALKQIADTINELIKNDPFPDTIQPAELRAAVRAYPERGGKRIRPALLMWACGLFGGDPEKVLNAAASVEIFHNWTLVHDDIIDEEQVQNSRRVWWWWLVVLGLLVSVKEYTVLVNI